MEQPHFYFVLRKEQGEVQRINSKPYENKREQTRQESSSDELSHRRFRLLGRLRGLREFEDLVREADNAFDPYAVAIYYEDFKLGFIPRGSNHDISKYLDMGLEDIFEVRITRVTPDVHPEQQVEVIVYIKNQN